MDYVRKLTYSSERLDQPEPLSTQLRRSKSESLPKRGRPRGQKQRKIRAATTEEKSPNVRVGEGEPVKRRRGRPRKIIPKEEPTTAETANPIESLNTNVPLSIDTSKGNPETERVNLEVPTKQDEPISELDNAKELTGSTNLSKDDIKMASSHQETDQKCAPDRVALDKSESAPKVEQEPHCKVDTPTETFDTALDESKVSESATNHIESEDKGLSSDKEKTQKESRNGHSKKTNDNENSVICTNEVELPVDMAEAKAVSGNILEESDSQLAEDFKLAEEILAAEVGKAVEANEVPVTSVQGEQNPVIEIVKELEQETISEVVPAQNENQSSADEENPVENQSPVKEPSSSKDEPPAEEHSPGPDQDPVVKQETPVAKNKQHDKEHNEASQAESLSGSDDPSSSGTLSKKRNHSSPANTPKKSKEIEALQSSVPRRALRSDKATPQNQRESRSKRTLKTELTLLMDDTMRRSSPRLGRSPAESHSSQERSPMEKKVTVSKLAKDLITIEKEKVIELKSLPDAPETKDVKITKTTTASDTSILTDENPSSSKTEQKKLKGKALKAKKMRTSETEVKKAISDSNEDIPSSSSIKCVDEHLTSSESEPKDEKEEILCPKPPIDCTNTDLEQSTAIETDTEQVEEKRSNRRKSRRIRNEKFKTETDTHSDHSDVKKAEKVPLETQQSDPVTAKKERNSGRLSQKDAENISKHFSQDSAKLKPSKAKSRNKRKKSEKKPSDSIAESDIEGALDVNAETVQATCSTSSQSNKKDMVKSGEKSEEPNLSETEIGRIRKRRQAVTIENTKDDFQITPQNENQSIAGFNSEEQVPRPESVDSSDTPIMKIPTKTYLMCTKNKTSLLTASEDPDTVPEQQKLITTKKGDSNNVSDVLTTEALDLDNANNLETSSSQDPKEHGFSDQTLTDNSDIIPSCTKKSQIDVPTTPTKSSDQTNSFITPIRSAKSKRNVSKETKKSDNSLEESQKAASESSASKEQKELRTPTASCRKLRVLIKRTPTSNLPTNSRKSIFKKTSAKSKRLSKILEIMEKRPSSEQCDNKPLVSSDEINPDSDPVAAESLTVAILHDSDRDLETNKIQNEEVFEDTEVASAEETDNKSKKKEDDHELEVNDICAASENPITDGSTKDASLNKATDSDVLQETKDELSNSLINATQDEDTPMKELPEEEVPNDKTAKDESEKQEILKDLEPDNAPLEEASAPTAKAAEEVDLYIKDKSNVKSVVAEPETDVTDDEFLVQSPIPNSSETTSVTDDPEPSTSSVVKRSLRKREADSSQPDEAAKRKQRQDVEKSLTGKKKPARRRQLAEVEERASHKRSKTELEAKSTVQGKFISIIGNETIMSSTTAPIRDTKSEAASTSPSARKPAVQESKHVETTKHIILGPPGKKLLHLDSPAAEVKKPMVQTLLSSTLSLQKPSTVDDGSPLKIRKSVKKSIADENIDGDQSILSSSSVLNKITSAVAPRKVNISVSLLQSKDTQVGTTASSSKTPILTKKEKLKTQKSTKKSEDNTKTESKKKSLVQGPQMKTQKSEEGLSGPKILNKSLKSETEFSKKTVSTVTGRKQIGQLEVSKKPESRKSEGSLLESNPRKKQSQVQRISKMDSRKSEGTSLTQPEVSKSETALKAALLKEAEFPVQVAEIEKMSKGRVHQNAVKNTKTEQPKSKTKTEVRSLDAEAAIDPMDSMNFQSDVSDIRAKFSEPQGIFNMPGHMPRAISSNRSLAPTPTPDRQRNASKERFTPVSDQKKPIRESQSLSKRRARGGKNQPLVSKRKAGEAEEDGTAVTNPKRPREMHEEDHPQQNDHVQEPAFAAFPVKITAASSVTHQVVHSTGNTVPLIVNSRKLCVKINRRPYNKWLRSTQERNIEQEGSRNVTSLPLLGETSETDSAGESTAESMLQSQVESEPVIQPLPASDPDSCPAQASDVQVRESSAQLAPIAANVSPAVNDSSTSPALDITPENAQTAKTTLKTGICSLTEQHLPDDPTLLDSSKNVAEPRKLQTFQAKCLPVPIPEVKSEPEDIMDEHSPNEPMPMVAAAPATPQPHAITEDPGPLTIQVNTLGVSTSSRPPELNSIPSASDPDGNPNTIGQTKMFSFLYPKRYKQSYDDVGLDFCCPNLDGPMRAIDFTRLHSKAEVPVLEVPQFLVITTKFISKADKNMPSKVRAKLELLGRSKERDSSKLTPTSTTPTGDPTGPSSFSPAPAPVGPATQPFPSIIQNLLSAPIPAPSPFNHPTTVDPSTSTPVVPGSSSSTTNSATLDSLSKQLPRGTTLTKKSVQQVATIPSLAGTSMVLNASPSFIQLPPICPNDKQRVELQARVQMFDLVLQTLSRRAANLSVAERQRTIEEIVRTSSLMAIDVDVGTKLLENYVHYLNKATSSMTPLTPAQINSSLGASTSSPLSKSIASSDTPQQGKKIPAAHVQQRSSLPATTMPLYDADRNTIGFPYSCSKSTAGRKSSYAANSTPVRASTSQAAAAALGKVQPRSTLGIPKSVREDASQFVNLNTTVCMPAPRTNAKKKPGTSGPLKSINSSPAVQKPSLCKQKTAPARTPAKSTARAKSTASLSAVLGETPADEFVSPAGMSLSTTGNPNVFIISHAGQQEESILPDSNSSVGHMETTEIKGELDDSAEIII
ncbi:GD25670 [Drosophila simulans]|uniref:GD25670 n=1 Tax=Drosophila simulans TaxID=7240 RepID=B4QFW3_DROSI|nr:GD25670 [Drosophila simulans]